MRGYAGATVAFAAFFAALGLWVSGLTFRGLDVLVAILYVVGTALGLYLFVRGSTAPVRRLAIVAAGLSSAGLVLHLFAAL